MNPILPREYFIPDVEAHQWEKNGPIYLYGSKDELGVQDYCSSEYQVFSSLDLEHWTEHGTSFAAQSAEHGTTWVEGNLYAPDCLEKDGKYYLYFCSASNQEGVAVSDSPCGPFTGAEPIPLMDGDAIDPAVFTDDDGRAYVYWGQKDLRAAQLHENRRELLPETLNRSLLNEEEHGFHEGPSLRKRDGIYYLSYTDTSRGKATCIGYATSRSPLGPFEKRGILIDNDGCDPESWNNHGSLAQLGEDWYIFYHRSSNGGKFHRRVCVERVSFDENGLIAEAEMTSQGTQPPLPATTELLAQHACLLHGAGCIRSGAEGDYLHGFGRGGWACFRYLDFSGKLTSCRVRYSCEGDAQVALRIDSPSGPVVGGGVLKGTGGAIGEGIFTLAPVKGVFPLYLCFENDGKPEIYSLSMH